MQLPLLDPADPAQDFPAIDTALTEPNGLLAVGGCLSAQRIISAYKQGIFPWYSPGEPILWWSPNPRLV
ncbi:MAG: leucyl/phenylalanyl-tRNA--protein transferase, partial [Methylococcales bacterium]|nr:leucyl/phenylalanyl-tRNA--protein transferase [Methylococcales bacterium]